MGRTGKDYHVGRRETKIVILVLGGGGGGGGGRALGGVVYRYLKDFQQNLSEESGH